MKKSEGKMLEHKLRKKVEWAFYNYNDLKQNAQDYIIEAAESQMTANYDKLPVQSTKSNFAENMVVRACDKNYAYKWCKVVEKTIEHFSETGKDTLIRLRYFEKLNEWRLCERLYVSRRALFDWIEDLLTYSAMVAIQNELIKI